MAQPRALYRLIEYDGTTNPNKSPREIPSILLVALGSGPKSRLPISGAKPANPVLVRNHPIPSYTSFHEL